MWVDHRLRLIFDHRLPCNCLLYERCPAFDEWTITRESLLINKEVGICLITEIWNIFGQIRAIANRGQFGYSLTKAIESVAASMGQ